MQHSHRQSLTWTVLAIKIQCCGSGMFILNPGSRFLPIPDPGSRIQKQQLKRGVKKICCHTFFWSHKFHKIVTKLSKIWVWDSGSKIRDPEKNLLRIPDPGVKKAPDPGSGSATLVSQSVSVVVTYSILLQRGIHANWVPVHIVFLFCFNFRANQFILSG